jgi:phosphoenolpyruvate synthase/pyruvate phosphate dikinase
MTVIHWLDECSDPVAAGMGGKGGSLTQLCAGGFPVPNGFVIGAGGYREWVRHNRLEPRIDALLAVPDLHIPRVAREATAGLTPAVQAAVQPPELTQEIIEAYRELARRRGGRLVTAVRSSALSEDGSVSSSAGLYETYLNIRDEGAVLDSVSECYRSLWAHRAVQYRAFKKLDSRLEAMAVVVMELIPSEVSGVAFTVNPVTGDRGEIMINASWGLGEAIVSGRVTPDNFIVRKEDRRIISRDIYTKEIMIVADPDGKSGTVAREVPSGRASAATLDDRDLAELADVCLRIEQYYGCPQDIEWARYDGSLYILQSRPVTGLG